MTDFDWDDAYDNMGHIPESTSYPPRWAAEAAAFRERCTNAELDLAYGEAERQRFDLFKPEGEAAGLVVFIHGGYWMRLDKSYWSYLAEGALKAGWAVAIPSYTLTPAARIAGITQEIAAAIVAAADRVSGPIRLTGHSAGGHLVARMACEAGPLWADLRPRLANVVSISGLHDLAPLMKTRMNETLHIDAAEAAAESPALLAPIAGVPVTAWVGGDERPEFIRQARLLGEAWPGTRVEVDPGKHHFTVLDGLTDPASPISRALLG